MAGYGSNRFTQRQIAPTAVKLRNLGVDILVTGVNNGTTSLANGQQIVFSITTAAIGNAKTFVVPDITVYQDSVNAANIIPTGANVTPANWQILFMGNDLNQTDGNNTVSNVFIRNISAGTHTVIMQTKSRVITNTAV